MLASIIIPVYNEASTVAELIEKVRAVDIKKEIIVVDDGSTDGSYEVAKALEGDDLKVILHEKNMGKGMALRTGIKHATGDIIIPQDADLELDPNDYHALIKPIVDGRTKVVYGSRILGQGRSQNQSFIYYLGGRFLTVVTNLIYNIKITDEATCYKVFDAKLIKNIKLECEGFEFCPEVTAKLAKLKETIIEVPIKYFPRTTNEGKKVQFKDAIIAVKTLLKYRFKNPRDFLIDKE